MMARAELSDWPKTPRDAIAMQHGLAAQVRIEPLAGPVATVAGVDCAFLDDGRQIIAAAVLLDAVSMKVLDQAHAIQLCTFPYVPGLLSFREAPAVIEAVRRLPQPPDLLMCDGQGLAHPRGLGLACHVGLLLDRPTIGVAKSRLCGEHREPALRRGSRVQLLLNGRAIGSVVRTRDGVRPLYVSLGHRITQVESVRWTLRCCRGFRLPEPTRLAHQLVSRLKKKMQGVGRRE